MWRVARTHELEWEVAGKRTYSGLERAGMYGDPGTREIDWYECIPFLSCALRILCPRRAFHLIALCTLGELNHLVMASQHVQ